MILLDTSGLLAAADNSLPEHQACLETVGEVRPPLLLSPFVLAELDYLVGQRLGQRAKLTMLEDVSSGAYRLEPFGANDLRAAREVILRHASLNIGLADASLVVLAERHGVGDVLTLDQRHFRAMTWGGGKPFRLLPADA